MHRLILAGTAPRHLDKGARIMVVYNVLPKERKYV